MTLKGRTTGRAGLVVGLAVMCMIAAGCQTPIHLLRDRGLRAYDRTDKALAEQHFQKIVDRRPADWQANYYLGRLALDAGDANDARVHLETAYAVRTRHDIDPGAPPKHRPAVHEIVDALAEALYRQGDHVRLIGFCDEAIDHFGQVRDYLRKAEYLQKLGDPDNTLVVLRQAARIAGPDDPTAHLALADFYQSMGWDDEALIALRRAYTIAPDNEQIGDRLRALGVVPGPTIKLSEPESDR